MKRGIHAIFAMVPVHMTKIMWRYPEQHLMLLKGLCRSAQYVLNASCEEASLLNTIHGESTSNSTTLVYMASLDNF